MDFQNILDQLFTQLNQCRIKPREFAAKVEVLRAYYHGNILNNSIQTREGVRALDSLVQDLRKRSPAPKKLKWSFALHMAADELANTLGQKGIFTTEGTASHRTLPDRVKDYAIVKGKLSEVYEFGGRTSKEICEELLIDDGLLSRKRRNTLLDPIFNYVGIGVSYHESLEACTVIILAEDIVSLVAPEEAGKYRRRHLEAGQKNAIELTKQVIIDSIVPNSAGPSSSMINPAVPSSFFATSEQVNGPSFPSIPARIGNTLNFDPEDIENIKSMPSLPSSPYPPSPPPLPPASIVNPSNTGFVNYVVNPDPAHTLNTFENPRITELSNASFSNNTGINRNTMNDGFLGSQQESFNQSGGQIVTYQTNTNPIPADNKPQQVFYNNSPQSPSSLQNYQQAPDIHITPPNQPFSSEYQPSPLNHTSPNPNPNTLYTEPIPMQNSYQPNVFQSAPVPASAPAPAESSSFCNIM